MSRDETENELGVHVVSQLDVGLGNAEGNGMDILY